MTGRRRRRCLRPAATPSHRSPTAAATSVASSSTGVVPRRVGLEWNSVDPARRRSPRSWRSCRCRRSHDGGSGVRSARSIPTNESVSRGGAPKTAAEQAGVGGAPSMTPREWAAATGAQLPVAARPMASLAEIVDRVSFAPPGSIDLEHAGAYGSTLAPRLRVVVEPGRPDRRRHTDDAAANQAATSPTWR